MGEIPDTMLEDLPYIVKRRYNQEVSIDVRKRWWTQGKATFPLLGQAAERLLSMHTTTCATERNWSTFGRIYVKGRSRLEISKAEKLVFIKGNHAGSAGKGVDEEVALNHMLEDE